MTTARALLPADEDAFIALLGEQIPLLASHLKFEPDVSRHYFRWVTAEDREGYCLFGAFQDGELVGYGLATSAFEFFTRAKSATLEIIYVRKESRGSFAAVRLMGFYEAWAQKEGAITQYVGVNHGVEAEKSLQFFEACGFAPAGAIARKIHGEHHATAAAA